ncbi:uncharacterized protein EV154DRAFT_439865 [Mucor mucedo]|uniref:uncharacterized protein n=1 Tax=Mucor mucedo TaxID=29922 RepID=UPI002220BF81|nr:uncharacterized protein EV154DRAFT_439865 [Mucor mucedo]KAI7893330.1 hypothetical protein EV154DRAFT_439865 [Mucor mucedo]
MAPSPPSPRANKGRVGKRLSATLSTMIHPQQSNPHGNNNSINGGALAKTIHETKYIEASELGDILEQSLTVEPLMIDMRSLENYEKSRIRHSINVNVPSLLIKRYKRGVVSNFNLSSFITTPEGTDYYNRWMSKFNIEDNNIQNLPEGAKFIVYDDHMMNEDTTTAVWTLMAVIAKNLNVASNVNWLKHGYYAFEKWDFNGRYIVHFNHSPPLPIPLFKPTPMISRSATTLSNKNNQINVQRRASLFSLDTTTLRSKHPSAMANVNTTPPQRRISSINEKPCLFSPSTPATTTSPDVFHTPLEQFPTASTMLTANHTPKVDGEFDFVISEIIPHFLYLGPEIATPDQLGGLKSKSIKRILNMAEECDDDVPSLKETFKYVKIDARDTVEMQNVEETLRKAVQVIDDAKKHHEPIYVHCKAGKSRSAAAILAYLVLSEHWTLKRAYRHIVKARPNISPNIGFVAELMKLEEGVHGVVSNFAGTDWHLTDATHPPSPDTQKEMGRLEKAWKRGRSQSGSRHRSLSSSSRGSIIFSAKDN